jgi:hypothetical protein
VELKVAVEVNIGFPQAVQRFNIDINDSELEDLDENEKHEYIDDLAREQAEQVVDVNWHTIE